MTSLVTGPYSHLSGIYGLQIYQAAEDLSLEPDEVRRIIAALSDLGWCTFEPPIIWIHGYGCQDDQMGRDFKNNPSDLVATLRHVETLPDDNGAVSAWRAAHGLTGTTAAAHAQQHPRRQRAASLPTRAEGNGKGIGIGTTTRPTGMTTGVTTGVTTGPRIALAPATEEDAP